MNPTLYFLRASEQAITTAMIYYATGKSLEDNPKLNIYTEHYGYSANDLGLYALVNSQIAGAAWIRLIDEKHTLIIGVKPEYQNRGIGSMMMKQIIEEASAVYEELNVDCSFNPKALTFFETFDFKIIEGLKMNKPLQQKEVVRPSDSYDPRRWMD